MKRIVLGVFCFSVSFFLYPNKIGTINEISHPKTMSIKGDRLFISEKITIFIYSLKDLKLQKKFGKEGEGPGEFKLPHGETGVKIDVNDKFILVNSAAKLSYYSHDGEFIKEKKVPPLIYVIPVKNYFVGNCLSQTGGQFPNLSVCLFDKNFNKKETLLETGVPFGMGAKIMMPSYNFKYSIYKDRIFISVGKENILIKVLDNEGKELYEIKKEVKPLPMKKKFKDKVLHFYRTDPGYKNFWDYFKRYLYFPKYFPGLKSFEIDGDRVYIQTHNEKNNQFEWIIFDLTGKEIKKVFLPTGNGSPIALPPFTFSEGKYYYLQENEENETWELFMKRN